METVADMEMMTTTALGIALSKNTYWYCRNYYLR